MAQEPQNLKNKTFISADQFCKLLHIKIGTINKKPAELDLLEV